jgi:hypothetical protein
MILTETQIEQVIAQAQTAFPNLTDWQYNNEVNGEYFGFALWGELVFYPEHPLPKSFFITLDTYQQEWRATLTIGQHSYLWSSADFGDAHLVTVDSCNSCQEAITALKQEMLRLFTALSDLSEI